MHPAVVVVATEAVVAVVLTAEAITSIKTTDIVSEKALRDAGLFLCLVFLAYTHSVESPACNAKRCAKFILRRSNLKPEKAFVFSRRIL
jgi:hypothetical protein